MITLRKHRFAFIVAGLIAAVGAVAPLFLIAGCRTLQQTPQEVQARETLRAMTRGGVLPAEEAAYIGDAPEDIEMGKRAGVLTVAVRSTYPSSARLLSSEPNIYLESITGLAKHFHGLF